MSESPIDLNVDLGEGGANDAELIALATSANIACGGHAGDEQTIRTAIEACLAHGVAIGAHPGHEDPKHFGRLPLNLPHGQIRDAIIRQLERFIRIASLAGATVHHVKLHGALYHQANQNPDLAETLAASIAKLLPGCQIYTLASGCFVTAATDHDLTVIPEAFADRRYTPDGQLVPRDQPDAVITNTDSAVSQALEIARHHRARTLCVHGDNPKALQLLRAIAQALPNRGYPLLSS